MTMLRQNTIVPSPVLRHLEVESIMVSGLPSDESAIAARLGVGEEQLKHVKGAVVEATLDVPAGKWRVWPDVGIGIWLGAAASKLPHMPAAAKIEEHNLREFTMALAASGLFLQRVRLRVDGEWTQPLTTREWLHRLDDPAVDALAGGASNGLDTGFGLELHRSGLLRTETPLQADTCFTLVRGLDEQAP